MKLYCVVSRQYTDLRLLGIQNVYAELDRNPQELLHIQIN